MTIFYRGPCVRITHEVIEVRCPIQQSFALRDLSHVRVAERSTEPAMLGMVRTGSTGVAGATAVAAGVGWPAFASSPALALATLGILAVSIAVSGACWRVRRTQQELVAICDGRPVLLYRSPDARTFGQVTRALLRALELGDT